MTAPTGSITPAATTDAVAAAVTALFVPGDRPERFAKAVAAGSGVVIIDLEDAVAPDAKAGALAAVLAALAAGADVRSMRALVRVNPLGSSQYDAEITALLAAAVPGSGLLGFMVPKAEDAGALGQLRAKMPGHLALVPLIESAVGVVNAVELARVSGVTRLAFGAIDFALDIDADGGDRFLDNARAQLVLASRAARIAAPLDSPSTEIADGGRVADSARLARNFGFGGKLCIHPAQLAAVRGAFAPTEAEIEWARSVIGAEGGAAQVDGQMIDRPVTERAKRILRRAVKDQ
ncbi:HpcH/HpaI aldolase/citrate lyase family protein [Arthrobacter bambusae]|uniref:HpcH/HpaI aldolase/citrate lyase family protein n=1 Tax=Arthrobacter bambusae TaxID=1338426 RepID=UPI002782B1C8|nr:CoA ester lyase [Arthrobacter bambusae]MDQ0029086.1 citrate lyase subunit beta/citryl-CoA lyase [Arthrobacter bambusae]MDQ0098512.1 citrate lyase subunit beta/citryl-CoA lyase [Arthrobacter bambusae]